LVPRKALEKANDELPSGVVLSPAGMRPVALSVATPVTVMLVPAVTVVPAASVVPAVILAVDATVAPGTAPVAGTPPQNPGPVNTLAKVASARNAVAVPPPEAGTTPLCVAVNTPTPEAIDAANVPVVAVTVDRLGPGATKPVSMSTSSCPVRVVIWG